MKTIRIVIFVLALLSVLGSVGALEVGNIGFGQCFLQGSIGTLVAWLAVRNTKD
jgi:hypothetical protein